MDLAKIIKGTTRRYRTVEALQLWALAVRLLTCYERMSHANDDRTSRDKAEAVKVKPVNRLTGLSAVLPTYELLPCRWDGCRMSLVGCDHDRAISISYIDKHKDKVRAMDTSNELT